MKRLTSATLAVAVTLGLLGLSPTASAFDGCPDPGHPIEANPPFPEDLTVGTSGQQVVTFALDGYAGCFSVDPPVVRILTPHREIVVDLHADPPPFEGYAGFSGSYTVDPADLENADAGQWLASYELDGTRYDETTFQVRRATTLTFDAGPEPVRHHTITYRGVLKRADWERGRYRGYRGEELEILALDPVNGQTVPNVAIARPSKKGRYYVRQPFPGANRYAARFAGDKVSAPVTSKEDPVAAP